jgi:hypothetical protein
MEYVTLEKLEKFITAVKEREFTVLF